VFSSECRNHWYDPTTNKWDCLPDFLDIMSFNDFDSSDLIKKHFVVSFSYPHLRIIELSSNSTTVDLICTLVSRRDFGFGVFDHYVYAVSCTYYK